MSMFAIISDIHSNIEALTVVLEDIDKRGIGTIYCLGDVVGYGPDPRLCLDLVIERTENCVMGNHDYGVFYEPTNFNLGAERASYWSRSFLESESSVKLRNARWEFLGHQKMRWQLKKKLNGVKAKLDFVHASPRRPINEYIFPDDVYTNPSKISLCFERVEHVCFIGHTHLPGVFLDDPDFYSPDELGNVYPIVESEKAIINVGSVGQPRDRDNRASYAYIEGNEVHFVRLEYDFEKTSQKIFAVEELDDFEGTRLAEGR
ncbi:MAG: metallophosphoesterase family protein [Planctomycetota bacterium]